MCVRTAGMCTGKSHSYDRAACTYLFLSVYILFSWVEIFFFFFTLVYRKSNVNDNDDDDDNEIRVYICFDNE